MRQFLKRIVRRLIPRKPSAEELISQRREQLLQGPRAATFRDVLEFVNYEKVEGDIAEFGVFTGRTLAALTYLNTRETNWKFTERRVVGFDWFQGLQNISELHARWSKDSCVRNHETDNPVIAVDERVSPEGVRRLFAYYGLQAPYLEVGSFDETVERAVRETYRKIAIAHIDCDLYESTLTVLRGIEPALQTGTVLLFDDWFHYRGSLNQGEARAFDEFFSSPSCRWKASHYRQYGVFCNSFIISERR